MNAFFENALDGLEQYRAGANAEVPIPDWD